MGEVSSPMMHTVLGILKKRLEEFVPFGSLILILVYRCLYRFGEKITLFEVFRLLGELCMHLLQFLRFSQKIEARRGKDLYGIDIHLVADAHPANRHIHPGVSWNPFYP